MKNFFEFLLEDMSLGDAVRVFGVKSVPSKAEITKLYRKLSMQNHPDRGGSTEKMAQINQAKQVLLKNVGKVGSFSSAPQQDDSEREQQRKTVTAVVNSYLHKFDSNIYKNYLEGIFNKTFTAKVQIDDITEKDRRGMVKMEFADEQRDIVFDLRIFTGFVTIWEVVNAWFSDSKKNFGGNQMPIRFILQSHIYVNGRKQALQKEIQKDSTDKGIFDDPTILLPRKKMDKFLTNSRPVKKRDFEAMFNQKFEGRAVGNGFYYIPFEKFVVLISRIVFLKKGIYRIHAVKNRSTSQWTKWDEKDYIDVPVKSSIFEDNAGFEFLKDALAQLKKDNDIERFLKSVVKYNDDTLKG